MLTDYTFFFGDLSIGQLSSQAVKDKLSWFIQQYEPEYLQRLLGYAAYKQFSADILLPTIPDRWVKLLYGDEFTAENGSLKQWKGLLILPSASPTVVSGSGVLSVVVGRGASYDPVNGSVTTTIPAGLVGKPFVFVQRAYGPLRSDEYSITGNQLTLLNGLFFNAGDTYFYFGDNSSISSVPGVLCKQSPVADFIYYWYQRSQVSNTAGTGEVKTETQNATSVSPKYKMAAAWNRMVDANIALYEYMRVNNTIYPEWYNWAQVDDSNVEILTKINIFNI